MKTLPPPLREKLERASRWMFTRIITSLARTIQAEDLSVAQLAALHLADGSRGVLHQSRLGEILEMSAPATSRMVDGLVARGLVERREAPEDRRVRVVRLTDHGVRVLAEIGEARVQLFEAITRPIPRAVLELLLKTIEQARFKGEV